MLRTHKSNSESGAAAVEFALIVPIFLLMVVGIVQFGYAYTIQISLTQAAREGARTMVVQNDQAKATAAAASTFGISGATVNVPATCPAGSPITVTVQWTIDAMGTLVQIPLTGKATMQCGG
jgi:Flp pilus assembly protein TadG